MLPGKVVVVLRRLRKKVYEFSIAVATHYYKFSSLNNRNVLSCSFGGQESEIGLTGLNSRCWQACIPSGCSKEKSVFSFSSF